MFLSQAVLIATLAAAPPEAVPDPLPVDAVEACAKSRGAALSVSRASVDGTVRPTDLPEDPLATATDLLADRVELDIDFVTRRIAGTNTMTARVLGDTPLTAFRFRLVERMGPTSVRRGGADLAWSRVDEWTVEVPLDPPVFPGESFDLTVGWGGAPISDGLGGFLFEEKRGEWIAWSLSEPWSSATWWAVKDDNRDKRLVDFAAIVPAGYEVVSNGLPTGVDVFDDGRRRWRWSSQYPITPYLVFFSAAKFSAFEATFSRSGIDMPVWFRLFPENDNAAERAACLKIPDMLRVFSDLYGDYPFLAEKYGVYQFSFGGGMEHQTFTGQNDCGESLSAHELGHQWWGDMVTCATWHDIWLNEGFATYSEALWFESKGGTNALLAAMEQRKPRRATGSVWVDDVTDVNRIFSGDLSYRKGGWVLHMLRYVVGDGDFFRILARWRERFAYASATTEDFVETAEEVTGRELRSFFDAWVYGTGTPLYRWSWRPLVSGGRHFVEFFVAQEQNDAWATFPMPIEFEVGFASGSERVRVPNETREEWRLVELPEAATSAGFDPDGRILVMGADQGVDEPGPPKIVAAVPAPGEAVAVGEVGRIDVVFADGVRVEAGAATLAGAAHGAVAVTIAWDATTKTLSVTPAAALPVDDWTLRLEPSKLLGAASNRPLDGELVKRGGRWPLPSGDGVPGGAAEIVFSVRPAATERPDDPGRRD